MNGFEKAVLTTETSITDYSSGHQSRAGFDPASIPARRRFLNRRMKLLSNLLRWRKYMGERFGVGILIGRLVERSIINVAESGWEVGGQEIAQKVSTIVVYKHQSGVHLTHLILPIRLPKCYQRISSHFPYEISEPLDECDILTVPFSLCCRMNVFWMSKIKSVSWVLFLRSRQGPIFCKMACAGALWSIHHAVVF